MEQYDVDGSIPESLLWLSLTTIFQIQNADGTKTTWINETQIAAASAKGYKVIGKRMAHAVPEWIQDKGEGGFLILDDYTRAD
jgi:hypothetical protein